MPKYLDRAISDCKISPPREGSGMTRDGYTRRSGAPSSRMIKLEGEKRWRRVMVWQFSNAGTAFVRIKGEPHIVTDGDLDRCRRR